MTRLSPVVLCAGLGLAACLILAAGAIAVPRLAYAAWLVAVLTVTTVPIGALPLLFVWHLHRGAWGRAVGPAMEAAVATLPAAFLLALPVLVFAGWFYPWGGTAPHQGAWLDYGFFLARGLLYFALWGLLARLVLRRNGAGGEPAATGALASAGLIIYTLTASFAGFDWVLSLQPDVYSSIFGLVFISHQMLGAFAFLSLVALLRKDAQDGAARGIGNMLLGGLMLWVYFEYMQYLIVWSGDLPGHTAFYLERVGGGWTAVVYLMSVPGAALPFAALLSGRIRGSRLALAGLAAWFLVVRALEAAWWVLPLSSGGLTAAALCLVALLGAGGLWGAAWLFALSRRPAWEERQDARQVAHG